MIDLNGLSVFASVVDAGSFTAGAEALGLPKGSVSRKVSRLEASLGVRLLHRTTRSLSLTDVGRVYYEHCRKGLAELEAAQRLIDAAQLEPSGVMRISAPVDFAHGGLADWVATFLTRHERARVELVLSDHYVDLVGQRIDLAFRSGRLQDSTFIARKLGSARRVLCASPDYLDRYGAPQAPPDVENHHAIVHGASVAPGVWRLRGPDGDVSIRIAPRVAGDSMGFAQRAARAGLGVALLPEGMVRADTAAGHLVRVLDGFATSGQGLYAVYPSNRQLSPNVRAFLDIVVEMTRHWHTEPPAME